MIAFIRARFPETLASAVWSDTVAANWFNPAIPFSLAHYWKVSTFQQVDFSFFVFEPVVVNSPQKGSADYRKNLVQVVLNEVDRVSKPDWNLFDRCIIFFAQATDMFGGGMHIAPNGKSIGAAVFDLESGFDQTCQEVGHTFGLDHERGSWHYDEYGKYTDEYGCPYSVMSAAADKFFNRAQDPRLPGATGPALRQLVVGPYLPTVHLYLNQYQATNPNGVFNHPDTVAYLPANYEQNAVSVQLFARDAAIAAWPSRRIVLAVVPPIVPGGDTHFLELRRKDGLYDAAIESASIIILAANFYTANGAVPDPSSLSIRYVGRIDLEGVEGDLDYHSFSGHFVVRVTRTDANFATVNLTVEGGNAWQNASLTLDNPVSNRIRTGVGDGGMAYVAPCPLYPPREYSYKVGIFNTFHVLRAHASGYEMPHYSWYLENVRLNPAKSAAIILNVLCRALNGHTISPPAVHPVSCTYTLAGGKLELDILGAFTNITLTVRVVVGESSPEVIKNNYPERSLFTTVGADNTIIDWDSEYRADRQACKKALSKTKAKPFKPKDLIPDPRPTWRDRIGIPELIRDIAKKDPRSAYAVAAEVAKMTGMPIENVLEDVFGGDTRGSV